MDWFELMIWSYLAVGTLRLRNEDERIEVMFLRGSVLCIRLDTFKVIEKKEYKIKEEENIRRKYYFIHQKK